MLFISLSSLKSFEKLKNQSLGIELRLDLFSSINPEEIRKFLKNSSLPTLLTLRKGSHGGKFQGSERQRELLILQLLELEPAFFDLEYDMNPKFLSETIKKFSKTKFILSYHTFEKSLVNFEKIYQEMQQFSAYSYKIATIVQSTK